MRAMKHVLVAVASASLLLAACGDREADASADAADVGSNDGEGSDGEGDDGEGDDGEGDGEASGGGEGLGVGDDYTVLGALAELPPAPVSSFVVMTADLTTASELVGLERPGELDVDAAAAWLGPLTGGPSDDPVPVMVPPPSEVPQGPQLEGFQELAGWSLLDVDSYVEFSTQPNVFTVVAGDFADDTLDHLPEVTEGVRTVGEGEDLSMDLERISAVSRTGQPVRMALGEGKLALAGRTPVVQSWLAGAGQTLADVEPLASLAGALDSADVVSAMIAADEVGAFGHLPLPDHLGTEMPELDFLPQHPFRAVALGWAVEGDEARIVLAYHYLSAAMAEASVEQLQTLFVEGETVRAGLALADLVEVEEISAEGPVVTTVLRAVDPRAPHRMPGLLMGRDVPFIHQ